MRGIAIALALVGCSGETGIMVVIDANPALPRPSEIVVMVGTPADGADPDGLDTFVDGKSDRFELEADRDLAEDPLRYLIRPEAGEAVKIAVAGLGEGLAEPLTAHYADTLEFAPGVVLEIALTLDQRESESFDECGRCFVEPGFRIASPFDRDCDGSRPSRGQPGECAERQPFDPDDCDDGDFRRNPYELEICDGADNDCDSRGDDYGVACFVAEADSCLMGTATCGGGGDWSSCAMEGDGVQVPLDLCEALGDCQASGDPVACYADRLGDLGRLEERTCEIEIAGRADEVRLCSTGQLLGFEPAGCSEVIVAAVEGPARTSLSIDGGGSPEEGQRIPCNLEAAAIVLGGERDLARAARLLFIEIPPEEGATVGHLIHLRPRYVESCGEGDRPVECL